MYKLSMLFAILMLFIVGSALAQPTYQFAEAGTKNFISETTVTVGDQISLDLYLTNVDVPQNAGGAWIDFSASTAGISYVSGGRCLTPDTESCAGPWILPGGLFLNEPLGAGTVLYQVGNLGGAAPDGDGDLIVGTLTLECIAAGDVTVVLDVSDLVAFWTPIQDADVVPASLLIHQGGQPCIDDDICDDGQFCTGVERCVGGTCQDGLDPDCDDGVGCTDDFCDEVNDVCANTPNDGNCDDGDFCTGVGTCDPMNDCQAGTDPCPDDGEFCTGVESCLGAPFNRCEASGNPCQEGEVCDDDIDECVPPPCTVTVIPSSSTLFTWEEFQFSTTIDGACDNVPCYTWEISSRGCTGSTIVGAGSFNINGIYTAGEPLPGNICNDTVQVTDLCNNDIADTAVVTVSERPPPTTTTTSIPTGGGVPTTITTIPIGATCINDKNCSDGIFCNGEEVCVFSDVSDAEDALYTWSSSFAAATGNTGTRLGTCQESEGPACPDDGDFCNGSESCDEDNAGCLSSGDPCEGNLVCDEDTDACVEPARCNDGTDCDDALFCNGRETCVDGFCQAGGDPCPPPLECDEENDKCLIVPGPGPGPGTLSFSLDPPRAFRSPLFPRFLIMYIISTDDATTFDQETTTVSFSGDAFLFPPLTQVLTEKRIGVLAVITRAGFGNNGISEVGVSVTTPEGEGTEILTLMLLPLFLSQ